MKKLTFPTQKYVPITTIGPKHGEFVCFVVGFSVVRVFISFVVVFAHDQALQSFRCLVVAHSKARWLRISKPSVSW